MLTVGRIVKIGDKHYKVTEVPKHVFACVGMCDLKNCNENEGFNKLKEKHGAKSCSELINLNVCFKQIK